MEIPAAEVQSFYRAALVGLRRLEAQRPTGRRFGADADARWAALRGDLVAIDRIDLLVRDADAQWPGAFGARGVFRLRGVAEDDAFGPRWATHAEDVDGESLWRDAQSAAPPVDLAAALDAVMSAWGGSSSTTLAPHAAPPLQPNAAYIVAGPSAIASLLRAFADAKDMDWSEQVVVVATRPVARQLAGIGAALINAKRAALVVNDDSLRRPGAVVVVSDDATAAERATAEVLPQPKRDRA